MSVFALVPLSGILPFGSIFIEMYFMFSSFWNYKFYYVYGFLLLVFVILVRARFVAGSDEPIRVLCMGRRSRRCGSPPSVCVSLLPCTFLCFATHLIWCCIVLLHVSCQSCGRLVAHRYHMVYGRLAPLAAPCLVACSARPHPPLAAARRW